MAHSEPVRVGVYICHCGSNIAEKVEVQEVRRYAEEMEKVVAARDYQYMCSEPGQEIIRKDICEGLVNRVVVASCSPRMHEPTFRKTLFDAGLNGYLLEMANIREQCSWCTEENRWATEKAKALVGAAVKKAVLLEPLEERSVPVNPDTLVVGGGVAGIEAALKVAEAGKKVYLVEREPSIGGHMARLDKTFPTLDCSACILTPKMVALAQNEKVELLTLSEVEEVSGYIGNFKVRVRQRTRYVDPVACTACGDCRDVCPVELPDTFNHGLNNKKAVYQFFPQAIPNVFQVEKAGDPAPCRHACPAGVNVPGYLALIKERKFAEALDLVREALPLPAICGRVCFHPCEEQCHRAQVDKPLAIKALKRFLTDYEAKTSPEKKPKAPEETNGGRVAVVGAGPAGLSAAYFLAKCGHKVTVFEKEPEPGGILRYGIPEYRLPLEILKHEINQVRAVGVEIRTCVEIGRDITLDDLHDQGYDAVLLATGALSEVMLEVQGADLDGILPALSFLHDVRAGQRPKLGKRVAVIGGGNAAVDAARTSLRLGAREVKIFYRRSRLEMPASPEEIAAAEAEGIQVETLANPVRFLGEKGRVVGLELVRMRLLEEVDKSGRRIPAPVQGSNFVVEADTVIIAIGQRPTLDLAVGKWEGELQFDKGGRVRVNKSCQTGLKGVFAAGDLVSGPASVVEAVGAAQWASAAIDAYIRGEPLPVVEDRPERTVPFPEEREVLPLQRQEMPELEAEKRRRSFAEVELGLDEEQAVLEAGRCLHCAGCAECLQCVTACQAKAIDHAMKDEVRELEVGSIIVATGFDLFDPSSAPQWGYGRYPGVVTALEFERMVNASGPTHGKILCKDGKEPKAVAILHCIGSRDKNFQEYCSRICCMTALKYAHLVREKTGAEVYNFYIDIRSFGKQYEEFYQRVQEEGVHFIRGKGAEVVETGDGLVVRAEDTLLGIFREVSVDLVILNAAMVPARGAQKVAQVFGLQTGNDGFFMETHLKLEPLKTSSDGIFLAGVCQGPKDIPDAVSQGAGAAAEALRNISAGKVVVSPVSASINKELCSGCRVCIEACPYRAVEYDEEEEVCTVNEVLCKGCGTCTASCPSGACRVACFDTRQLMAQIEGVLAG